MCLGVPGEIVEFSADSPGLAEVDVAGVRRTVNVGLLSDEDLAVGDRVLVHLGFAMSRADEGQSQGMDFLEEIAHAYEQERAETVSSAAESVPRS